MVFSFMSTDIRLGFGRVHLKVPVPMQLWVANQKREQHGFKFFG